MAESNNLKSLFSDASRQTFARTEKQIEFSQKHVPVEQPRVKKPKHKATKETPKIEESTTSIEVDNNQDDKTNKTIFVGNIPIEETVKSITKYFEEFGEIESVRLRSLPIAGTAIDDKGNQTLVKKVCAFNKKFGDQKSSLNAYVVFKTVESANKSLLANNRLIQDRHIRVDHSNPTQFDHKKTVFIGSLPYYVDEEKLRIHFANVSFYCFSLHN